MSNPSPEPSAESLAEARELLMRTPWPYTEGDIRKVALALDAAKRSSRREALGQAADAMEFKAKEARRTMKAEGPYWQGWWEALEDASEVLRALMEAE